MESENLTASLDPRCKCLESLSLAYLESHQAQADARLALVATGAGRILANGRAVSTWSTLRAADLSRRFVEEYVYLPIQDVVSITICLVVVDSSCSLIMSRDLSS